MNNYSRCAYPEMANLLASFPTLQRWDWSCWDSHFITDKGPDGLRARYKTMCSAGRHAVNLALEVWNSDGPWKKYGFQKFSLRCALGTWDPRHHAAFLAYVENPFLP
jgi:hypothetical protein